MNPYEPPETKSADTPEALDARYHAFAGWWLVAAGVIHWGVANAIQGFTSFSSIIWSPAWIVLLGVLVALKVRIACVVARLIGSCTIFALVMALVLYLTVFDTSSELTAGDTTVDEPEPWQVALVMLGIALTFLPPWWVLQKVVSFSYRLRPLQIDVDED